MWSYGSKHGDGNYTNSTTGAVITGVWNSETEICHGIEKYKNQDVYMGEFFQEERHGEGILTTIDGSEYIGQWKFGSYDGVGTYRSKAYTYTGEWQEGKMHGKGLLEYPDGQKYEGEFDQGVKSGHGTYIWQTGKVYIGQWVDGK